MTLAASLDVIGIVTNARAAFIAGILATGCLLTDGAIAVANAQTSDAAALAALKPAYRRPPPRPVENQALVDLGRELFFDSAVSASGTTACVSCHLPQLGWAV